ncbi:MAG: phosphate transporter permease subunit PstC [Verrucomicrobiota bacterium]|jgi:phosphate transport system permease protein
MPAPSPVGISTPSLQRKGFSYDRLIRYFFASNAGLTIVILLLIVAFLLKEGLGFFPGYRRELEIYRITGMEFVDISRGNLTSHEQLSSLLNRAYFAEINGQAGRELQRATESSALVTDFEDFTATVRDSYFAAAEEATPQPDMLQRLQSQYVALIPLAVKGLKPSPSLTAGERQDIIHALTQRPIDNEEIPAFVNQLAQDYALARQKAAQPWEKARSAIDEFESAGSALSNLVSAMSGSVKATKDALSKADMMERERKTLSDAAEKAEDPQERQRLLDEVAAKIIEKPDLAQAHQALQTKQSDCKQNHLELREKLIALQARLSFSYQQPESQKLQRAALAALPKYLEDLQEAPQEISSWKPDRPVSIAHTLSSFLMGKDWITGGEWQDFYGILPLLTGSLMIAVVALVIAIPVGIGAAIYTNQFASQREQRIIKPVIEFIQAIPSVVLGFIGIFLLGEGLRELSTTSWLSWFPGFPMDERLNIFTAGCLLALMSIPTIFSLAEDAINNVPSAYSEASEALGASKLQTTFRVVVPAAFSGILAAILLGFGRVIGETMVVLLVAGNRIKIPDFSAGLGAFFQPAHTMTGIIAQELGEVPVGSVHYRALFVVGILLFAIVLGINATAHHFTRNMKH